MEFCTDVFILHQPAAYISHNAPLPLTAVCQQQLMEPSERHLVDQREDSRQQQESNQPSDELQLLPAGGQQQFNCEAPLPPVTPLQVFAVKDAAKEQLQI